MKINHYFSSPYRFWHFLVGTILIASILMSVHPAAAQDIDPMTGYGQACAELEGSQSCFDFELSFVVLGGDVQAVGYREQEITQNGVTVTVVTNLSWVGSFEGGDGGFLSGTWQGEATIYLPEGQSYSEPSGGTWEGNLYADGTGSGTWTGVTQGQTGSWSISYPSEEFLAGLPATVAPSAVNTETPPTLQPSPNPTQLQPSTTPFAPLLTSDTSETPDDQGSGSSAETPQDLESEAAEAAGDPFNALAGGTAGTLLGGLLAYLVSRGSDLTDKGSELISDLETAHDKLKKDGLDNDPDAPLSAENREMLSKVINRVSKYSDMPMLTGKAKESEGYIKGTFRKISSVSDSAYQTLTKTINSLSIAENLAKLRGMDTSALKKLGPISFIKNTYDRSAKLLKKREGEPLLYQVSTIMEATTIEAVKTVATANPFIFIEDQAIGTATGQPPSEYIADEASDFIPKYYMKWLERSAPKNVELMKIRRDDLLKNVRETKEEFEAKIKSGELNKEEGEKELRGILRAYRKDYVEQTGDLIQFNGSVGK